MKELIESSTDFFCQCCLTTRPLEAQSPSRRYCQACYETINGEKNNAREEHDYWTDQYHNARHKDELISYATFVHYGMGYQHTKSGRTICIGSIKKVEKVGRGSSPKPSDKPSGAKNAVSKLPDSVIPPANNTQTQKNEGVMKHRGGRPRRKGQVSRITTWRRQKEKQGALL